MNKNISSIGVIGFGRFGSFFADHVLPKVFPKAEIRISSRSHVDERVQPFEQVASSDLVIPAVPIRSMPEVLPKIAQNIQENAIVMDVCSVNVMPAKWMREFLPEQVSIISSHPMFGTSSYEKVKHDLSKLTMVIYPERIDSKIFAPIRDSFKAVFNVIEMSPDEHDQKAAQFQFLSHLLGGVLRRVDIKRSSIDTESASSMFDMMDVLNNDSMELFEDIYKFNPYAKEQFKKFSKSYEFVTSRLRS